MVSPSKRRPKAKSGRQSGGVKTALAKKKYARLTLGELAVIETPSAGVTSWMHFGIRMKMADPTKFSPLQTPGFPYYAPNLFDLNLLKERLDPAELQQLLETMPWRKMFEARPKELFFHKLEDLSDDGHNDLDEWMGFICGNSRALWNMLHWFVLDKPSPSMSDLAQKILTKRNKTPSGAKLTNLNGKWRRRYRLPSETSPGSGNSPSRSVTGSRWTSVTSSRVLHSLTRSRSRWRFWMLANPRARSGASAHQTKNASLTFRKQSAALSSPLASVTQSAPPLCKSRRYSHPEAF
jgi:hypothetical protein